VSARLLAFQHIACEPPAAFEDEARARGLGLARVELDEGQAPPDWRDFDGLIVMGGPMGAYEDDSHPWLAEEKRIIAAAARSGHPVWGVCLGAQLLAAAQGAPVYRNQAFSYRTSYRLQFHVEVSPELAREWGEVPAYADSLERTLGPGALPGFLAEVDASAAATLPLARSLFGRWLDHAVGVQGSALG
jgi:GMP synthase-like glutamine amidotransferase